MTTDQGGEPQRAQSGSPTVDDGSLDKILLLCTESLFLETEEGVAREIVRIVSTKFPVQSMIIFTNDKSSGKFVSSEVFGYPSERIPIIKEKVVYDLDEITGQLSTLSSPLGRFSRLFPAELYRDIDEKDLAETLRPEEVHTSRKDKDSWHPLDRASFYLIDRSGKEIGYIYITSTSDGKVLSPHSVAGLDIVASIASVAIELAEILGEEAVEFIEHEHRAAQMSQILTVVSSILTLTDSMKLIDQVLRSIDDLFGFKSSSIALYDEAEDCYRWVGFNGYSEEQVVVARKLKTPREVIERDIKTEYRIGYLAHFKPAEKKLPEDFTTYFVMGEEEARSFAKTPREAPSSWHPLDDMAFLVQDRAGKTIGVIYIDNPIDGKIPSRETIEMIEVFVSLVAIAIENASLYSEAHMSREGVNILNRLMFHDLMNYSMAIRGYLDLAMTQSDDVSSSKFIERSLKQIDLTADLVGKVRKLSTIRSADRKNLLRIDLASTIRQQTAKTAGMFPSKSVKYSMEIGTEDAFVMANDLLPDLLHNMLMNAIKFDLHEVVNLEISLKESTDQAAGHGRGFWTVSIADHGPGIPDERKRHIFQGVPKPGPNEPARGMGLGLSIVRSLVDLYGGKVWVEDREQGHHEKGSVFFVQFPKA
jgi:signal transduction histidine kinase